MGQRMTGGWLRRNALALGAVVLLVPLTLGVTFSNEWVAYYANRPSQPVAVAQAGTAEYGGTGWVVEGSRRISSDSAEGRNAELPAGSQLVIVTVAVTPRELSAEGESTYCELRLEEQGRGELARSWGDATFEPIEYRSPEGVESGCNPEVTTPYRMEAVFVIPSEVDAPLALRVEVVDELPRYLAFTL